MKKSVIALVLFSFVTAAAFIGCESSAKKESDAREDVEQANKELEEVQQKQQIQDQKRVSAEEWALFKKESELKIAENELRISELKSKKDKKGKTFDSIYAQRIETLEQKNAELKSRIYGYEKEQSDWDSFKREFNHDMDELGQALKDLTVDNKS